MVIDKHILTLIKYANLINEHVQGLQWYVFGSLIKNKVKAIDIDILIVYKNIEDPNIVRSYLHELQKDVPIDLIFMTKEELIELDFCSKTNAKAIFPNSNSGLKILHR